MHRPARDPNDGKFTEWPNGHGEPPRMCRETGFLCQSAGWVAVTRNVVIHRCVDCGRRWMARLDDDDS